MRLMRIPSAAVVTVLSVAGGMALGSQTVRTQDRDQVRARVWSAALAVVEKEYVDELEASRLVYASIDGMLRTLDPHSSFFDPREFAQMRERQEGRYFGIGVTITTVDKDVTITSLFEGSPAYKAGMRRGDIIAMVGEEDAHGWSTEDVVKRVKGPKGTFVQITLRRPGLEKMIPITVERDEINIVTVRTAFMIAPGTGYIRLQDFSETSDREMGEALTKLKAQGMQRLMLDLRENPGGPLDQAIAVANRFLKKGSMIVSMRGRITNSNDEYRAVTEGGYQDIPMIVMVNRQSASASEIVSGAMQDHDRALIVGERTFGKALVQSVYPIANDAGIAVTTGRYYTPSDRMIQRPWDGAFDDYLTYSLKDQEETREHNPADLKYTSGGRKVYGGGGIEPDHFILGPVEGFNPTRFARLLVSRGGFIGFAEKFTKEGDQRPGAQSAAMYKVAPGWQVTDAMIEEFKKYLTSQGGKIDEAAFKTDLPFIRAMMHYEVDVDLFSVEEARRNLSKVDPQIQKALGYFDEAKALIVKKTQ